MHYQRLDKALSFLPEIQSRSRAEQLIDSGHILVNGKNQKASYQVQPNDQIQISFPEAKSSEIKPLEMKLDILFEDSSLIVLNKPPGLVVHPAAGHSDDTLVNALVAHTQDLSMKFGEDRPGIVHRLDRDTSGILVVAKNDETQEKLSKQFRDRTIHRIYYAICLGVPRKQQGVIQSYLARHPTHRKKYASVLNSERKIITEKIDNPRFGKWAITHFKVIKTHPASISYLQLKLETGRTHQIRVHLSEAGCPILGDELYGSPRKIKAVPGAQLQGLLQAAPRCALHAAELGFVHPKTGEEMSFSVDWPDFQEIQKTLFGKST